MMNMLFWIDRPESLHPDKDTSLAFMREAQARGHQIYYLSSHGVTVSDGQVRFHVHKVSVNKYWALDVSEEGTVLTDDDVDVVVIRKDPPFDEDYLRQTWLLDLVGAKVFVSNHPTGVRTVNEKIWVSQFTDLCPQTRISSFKEDYENFLHEHKLVVLKPYDSFGGQGVCVVDRDDWNKNALFELLSQGGRKPVVMQEFLSESQKGDKRVLLLDGEVLGAVLRKHSSGDHRNNFMAGGHALPCEVTAREQQAIAVLRPHLKALGLHFVGLDFIGERLIEVNVTSPTCLREMNHLYQQKLESQVIDFFEKQARIL